MIHDDAPFDDFADCPSGLNPEGAIRADVVEFGRTSKRADSRPALHKIRRDLAHGPYWYELIPVDRTPFEKRRWEKQHPEKVSARKVRYDQSEKGQERYEKYGRSEKGRERRRTYDQSEKGCARTEAFETKEYLSRPIVSIDSEGRCPLHMIDAKGRSPLQAWKEDGTVSPYLKFDPQGNPFEPHEIHLMGAQGLDRAYQEPLIECRRTPAVWAEPKPGQTRLSTDECLDWLLDVPEKIPTAHPKGSVYVMFAAMYDWSMWLIDLPFGAAYSVVKQRAFKPPCERRQGYQFFGRWAIQMQPHRRLDVGELRWPDDPYGQKHKGDPEYSKPAKGQNKKLQFRRKIRVYDTFRHSPMSFVKTIKPLVKRGFISQEVFDRISTNKLKRGSFHDEPVESVMQYTSDELHSLCVFMYMMRDAYWNALGIKLKSFHSPASAASELLKRIGIRDRKGVPGHSWSVKSVDLDYEQIIAHHSYFGGLFQTTYKGYFDYTGFNADLASAYPYAMQSLPSMRGGRWERETQISGDIFSRIKSSCILSIFRVKFGFPVKAPFYPLPYRNPDGTILYPSMGEGFYMRDDVLNGLDFCKKYKLDPAKTLFIKEANWFFPTAAAADDVRDGRGPFAPIAEAFNKRIEFDQNDPGGPEQLAIKLTINSTYGKTAERIFRGVENGAPIIPPHISPWYSAAITAHTRRELMKGALLDPDAIVGFATDALQTTKLLKLPRLKSEDDIDAKIAFKRLGDWTWKEIPRVLMVQSGLAFYLNKDRSVAEVKCRGLPLKDMKAAAKVVSEIFEQWKIPYDGDNRKRFVKVPVQMFIPITSAIASKKRYALRGYWGLVTKMGLVTKTIWLDDPGGKRGLVEDSEFINNLGDFPMETSPAENSNPDRISQLIFPDWVENEEREVERRRRAVAQYNNLIKGGSGEDEIDRLLVDMDTIEP